VRTALIILSIPVAVWCAACRGNSTAPSPVSPTPPTPIAPTVSANFAGAWRGSYVTTQCQGQRHCFFSLGQSHPFSLRLEQSGSHVRGVFQAGVAIPVDGEVSNDGELSLTGTRPSPGGYSPALELTRFTARLSPTGLAADFSYRMQYADGMMDYIGGNSLVQSIGGTVAGAEHGDTTPVNSFAGQWSGSLFISDCSSVGWIGCWPEERNREYGFELTLSQSGDRVTGELTTRVRLQVTGVVNGDTLTLEPAVVEEPQSSGSLVTHLQRWEMTRDAVGSVRGEMYYKREAVWSNGRPPYSSSYYATIVYGVPVP
jgi:hypothetical protein